MEWLAENWTTVTGIAVAALALGDAIASVTSTKWDNRVLKWLRAALDAVGKVVDRKPKQ